MNDNWRSRPKVMPIYQSSSYAFSSLDDVDAVQEHDGQGFIYARYDHPNANALAAELARLELAPTAVVTSSGQAAMATSLLTLTAPGDSIVSQDTLYGGTMKLMTDFLPQMGIDTIFCDCSDVASVEAAVRENTKVIVVETIANPLLTIPDLENICKFAHQHDIKVVVDNTFATPLLCNPIQLGADIVTHSITKFLSGHSDVMMGACCSSRSLTQQIQLNAILLGPTPDPFASWLASKGLRTFALRVERQCDNALAAAKLLQDCAAVTQVFYPGLPDHPDHERARDLFGDRFGAMVSFELAGGRKAADAFLKSCNHIQLVPSLGDINTTVSHPASTSHRNLTLAEQQSRGISEGLLRLSIGCEDTDMLLSDLTEGITAVT